MQILGRTKKSRIRERGVYGQTVLDLHQQISRIVARRTGRPERGMLFAEPSHNKSTGEIIWYTRQSGPVKAWSEMNAAEQANARAAIDEAVAEVLAIALEYRRSESRAQVADADAFFAALGYDANNETCQIDYERAYLVGEVPVLTEWGCDFADGPRKPVSLSNVVGHAQAAPPVAAPPPVTPAVAASVTPPIATAAAVSSSWPRWWRLLWLMLGLLLTLMLMSLLMRGCAPLGFSAPSPTLGGLFPETGGAVNPGALDQERALREEIQALGGELDERALQCLADDTPPESPPAVADATPDEEEDRLSREGGTLGVVNVSLQWNNTNDLDLMVTDPHGETIFFDNRRSASGGVLDVDMNAGSQRSPEPIENVQWANNPPQGRYSVAVLLFEVNERGSADQRTEFTVTVTIFGEKTEHRGSVANRDKGQRIIVTEFAVP